MLKWIEKDVKAPNLIERAKEEIEAIMHREKKHNKETHGMRDDIDETTPIDEIKGPNVFERAKEEIGALVETIHSKKEHDHQMHSEDRKGFWELLGRSFEKFCSPFTPKRD